MNKPSVIMSVNDKVGINKVTLASDLALNLSKDNKVLIVDCDPNGVLATARFETKGFQLQESFTEEIIEVNEISNNLYILQGSEQLTSLTPENTNNYRCHERFPKLLGRKELEDFDYIIIDALSVLRYTTISGFLASNQILISFSITTLDAFCSYLKRVESILDSFNYSVPVYGVLVNEDDASREYIEEIKAELEKDLNIKIFDSYYSKGAFLTMQTELDNYMTETASLESSVLICKEAVTKLSNEEVYSA